MTAVVLHEVGLRDGLQMEARHVPTATKLDWAERLLGAGLGMLQAGSFVNPQKVPAMADTAELFAGLRVPGRPPGVLSALVLNRKGLERALAAGAQVVCMGVSASETHSRRNTGMSIATATAEVLAMAAEARAAGLRVQASVQSAFGCGYEGPVPPERVLEIAARFADAGLDTLSLADTAGHATPENVESLFGRVLALGELDCACHFHDTYGLALANAIAALRVGVTCFESSIAGLGGCPFTAIAGGNLCTEDFVHYLHTRGLRLDVQLEPLVALANEVALFFGREMPGSVYKTMPYPAPAAAVS